MRRSFFTVLLVLELMPALMHAQEKSVAPTYKVYGFIRNYFAFDTRESEAGTLDLLYFLPKDQNLNLVGDDMNSQNSFRFLALTSRVGLDVLGYQHGSMTASAKVEADFYCMNGNTATLRVRQAYMNLGWKLGKESSLGLKMGQAWHPMGVDMPDVLALAVGAPFSPFNRSPQVNLEYKPINGLSFNLAGIWQMQYLSNGPSGNSADYMKYSGIPEIYAGVNYTSGGLLMRLGADMLSIKPRYRSTYSGTVIRAADRITTVSPFFYAQYKKNDFTVKAKTVLAQGGEHLNLMSGYALSSKDNQAKWSYTPYTTSSSWVNLTYGKEYQGVLLLGYMKNFGTTKPILGYNEELILFAQLYGDETAVIAASHSEVDKSVIYFNKSAWNLNQMFRVAPNFLYNYGKFTLGIEYELTGAQYGSKKLINLVNGLADIDRHWVLNNRVTVMTKLAF
ncbi:MAG: hypothetical protein MJY83_04250 [Bacteroidales bacterium]|nr:hypothetical protein [Bacteroidales bacterium]